MSRTCCNDDDNDVDFVSIIIGSASSTNRLTSSSCNLATSCYILYRKDAAGRDLPETRSKWSRAAVAA
jgi:hypothetical protein